MAGGERGAETLWTGFCTVVAMDPTKISYTVCAKCERSLPENSITGSSHPPPPCLFCNRNSLNPKSLGSKRLYRLLLSIATEDRVRVVICFDRAARVLIGTSADEFFDLCKIYPSAAEATCRILEGEICKMTLNTPTIRNAQNLRVASVVPVRSNFSTAMVRLNKIYGVVNNNKSTINPVTAETIELIPQVLRPLHRR